MSPINATTETFTADTSTGKPTLVYFWATWCGPCRQTTPIVEAIAAESDVTVVKVDVDAQSQIALDNSITGVPTFVITDGDGEVIDRFNGAKTKTALLTALEQAH